MSSILSNIPGKKSVYQDNLMRKEFYMQKYITEQENFWAGEFGKDYIERNKSTDLISANTYLFSQIISKTRKVKSIIEFGCNIGLNLIAIKSLFPDVELSGIEINADAIRELSKTPEIKVYHQSILDFKPDYQRDLALIKGVLIHINPDMLKQVYALLYNSSKKYVCIVEYYNPVPVELEYRGHKGKLFKRDFAGEMLDLYKDLNLVDYGFSYHRDNNFKGFGDFTWFLLEKE